MKPRISTKRNKNLEFYSIQLLGKFGVPLDLA